MRWAVILAGGSGARFWPLSTPDTPKQLLPLTGPRTLLEESLLRLEGLVPPERTLVVAGAALQARLRALLELPAANILAEPRAASTGPALVWATWEARRRDRDADVLSVHADWTINDAEGFRRSADAALGAARAHDRLVLVGVMPSRPEPGYGYLIPGDPLGTDAKIVKRFTEKPDRKAAEKLIRGGALWNSGMFAWTADRLLQEVTAHTPEIAPHLSALQADDPARFFGAVTPVSIDVGVLERSALVAMVPGKFEWDDIGTWEALPRVRDTDPYGNVAVGPVFAQDSSGCVAWSDAEPIVLSGVKDLVVVRANGRILVMHRSKAAELKATLDQLPSDVRDVST